MSILSQYFNTIINRGVSAPGHNIEVVDGLNAIEKRFVFHIMTPLQLPCSKWVDTKMLVHTATKKTDESLEILF